MQRPIDNCYWVLTGRFLAGEYPRTKEETSSRTKLAALQQAGITVFIDLTTTRDGLLPYAGLLEIATYYRFPIQDMSVPESPEVTVAILDALDAHLARGAKVYLHCWGGVGRTGVIVGCWLARHGYPGEAALAHLRELWQQCPKSANRQSPETPEQMQYIRAWAEQTPQ
ncbi:MAG TPA: hypothetical protein PKH77_21855 [Anaerolineae bacterium]|nr:hypothetical protein [Anaerolineae bacterium]